MSALERLKRRSSVETLHEGNYVPVQCADLALALAVIEAGSELDREYENPAPDYTMRNVLRQRLHKSIDALTKD